MAPLNQEQVGIGFQSILRMKVQYPLGAKCIKIRSRYLPTFLCKQGINLMTATVVRHGPASLGRMEILNLKTKQAIQNTKRMVAHLGKDNKVGFRLTNFLGHLQLQAGTSCLVLSRNVRI